MDCWGHAAPILAQKVSEGPSCRESKLPDLGQVTCLAISPGRAAGDLLVLVWVADTGTGEQET